MKLTQYDGMLAAMTALPGRRSESVGDEAMGVSPDAHIRTAAVNIGWVCICAPGAGPRSLPAGRGLSAPDIGCAPPIAARLGLVLGSRTEIAGTCVQLHGPSGDVETHKLQARLGSMVVLCLDRRTGFII